MSRSRLNTVLLLILAALTLAVIAVGCRSLFREPEQKEELLPETPVQTDEGQAVDEEALAELYDRQTEREIALAVAEKAFRAIQRDWDLSEEEQEYDDWGNPILPKLSDKEKAKIARKLATAGFSSGATYDAINRLK